ncbi:MAG TPA: cupin domain-containing protein [Terriglobia bacterium]|nr:cupin domain-containing protein [Terriglobia bacterium]
MQRRTYLKTMLAGAGAMALPAAAQEPNVLAGCIKHTDPSKYHLYHSHQSPGYMACQYPSLVVSSDMTTNLQFIDRCQIMPGGGVGAHFHNHCEEMYVIFDGEAQFTIDGRTSLLKAPAGAPCRMGHSHAIYNHTNKPVEFVNINVSAVKGRYDAFNLDDARIGVPLDPIPVFMTMRLDKTLAPPSSGRYEPSGNVMDEPDNLLRPIENYLGGQGAAHYRRCLHPEVFLTNWSYVDHLVLPPGTSEGLHLHAGVEEVYYVMSGEGEVQVNGETAAIKNGDAVPVHLREVHACHNNGSQDLELMIIGIATQKWVLDTEEVK